jgi:hypothetical protein
MGRPEAGKFNLDFELGRKVVRRLGIFRPFLGAVFGLALFALLASGLLQLHPSTSAEPYYYGFAAFLAGFNERFARTTLSAGERQLAAPGPTDGSGGSPDDSSADDSTI